MASKLHLNDFKQIFHGAEKNFGQHIYGEVSEGEKENGKSWTVKDELVKDAHYEAHLDGKKGLGVIPINERSKAKFGVIDVDIYDVNLSMYIEAIDRHNIPLVPFLSKSGGLHIYMFLNEWIPAKKMIEIMQEWSIILGLDILVKNTLNRTVEIFPKQAKAQPNAPGTWINLPYYGGENSVQTVLSGGERLGIDDGLNLIKSRIISLEDAESFIRDLPFIDGPPCLQTIYLLNPTGHNSGRNNYLFAFGTYLKKKDENFFEQQLTDINNSMLAPLPEDELNNTVINSLRKKDYSYPCTKSPCVDFCRKSICKNKPFGVGKLGGYFSNLEYGQMKQIRTSEPYYEWEIRVKGEEEFKVLRFKNELEIISQDSFHRLCFRELHILPIKLKQAEWYKLVNQYLEDIEVIEVDKEDDMSPYSLFMSLFSDFLQNRALAQTKDQIASKRVYFDDKDKTYYFRGKDLIDFLFVQKNFKFYNPSQMHGLLKDIGAVSKRIKTESKKQIRVYALSEENFNREATSNDIGDFEPDFSKYDEDKF